jgi:hypothetical protein
MLWVLLSFLLLVGLLLWLPFELEIDTPHDIYRARWRGIFSIRLVPVEGHWKWFYKLFFWENPLRFSKKKPRAKKPATKKSKSKFTFKQALALFRNLLHAIKIKRFRLDIDTGDYVRNAQLYPLFHSLSKPGRQCRINFMGKEELEIHLQTRLWSIAGAFLRTFITPKIFHA